MKRPRRRTILNVLLLLIAGAALNVAVAWGIALFDQYFGPTITLTRARMSTGHFEETRSWERKFWHNRPKTHLHHSLEKAAGWRRFGWERVYMEGSSQTGHDAAWVTRSGWPLRSFEGAIWHRYHGLQLYQRWNAGILILNAPNKLIIYMPWHVRPFSFIVNTLFYVGALWMLFVFPVSLRRMIRRRCDRCSHCDYPIGTSEICTECGAAVTPGS